MKQKSPRTMFRFDSRRVIDFSMVVLFSLSMILPKVGVSATIEEAIVESKLACQITQSGRNDRKRGKYKFYKRKFPLGKSNYKTSIKKKIRLFRKQEPLVKSKAKPVKIPVLIIQVG